MAARTLVGDLINFRGMVRAPANEQGVVFLFGKLADDLGFEIEVVRSRYPDCIAKRRIGKLWEEVRIEFEFKSSDFVRHNHEPRAGECDIIVCWEHDWHRCPRRMEVIELRKEIKKLVNRGPAELSDRRLPKAKRDKMIRDMVKKGGLTRAEIIERSGLDKASISRILRGLQ